MKKETLAQVFFCEFCKIPQMQFGRALEKDKTTTLKKFSGNCDKQMSQISYKASMVLHW